MTDDIFDYFSGNSTRKVEPIEDDDDELIDTPGDASEGGSPDDDLPVAEETVSDVVKSEAESDVAAEAPDENEETVSHWQGLLSKLGISSPAKAPKPPKSVDIPSLSDDEKAERAARRKAKEQSRNQTDQPFGGIAAPPGSKPISKQPAPNEENVQPSKTASRKSPAKKDRESPTKPEDKPAPSYQFGLGILDEITGGEESDVESPQETKMLEDLFPASEDFVPPFEEKIELVDDVSFDDEPTTARLHKEPAPFDEPETDDADDDDFIEYEIQDLDFTEDGVDDRKRRPTRRDRARRNREAPAKDDRGSRGRSQPKRDDVDETKARSTRGRTRQDRERVADEDTSEAVTDSGKSPSRRGSRGRHRGRGSRPSRETQDQVVSDENDFDESLDVAEVEDFDDRDAARDRNRGRNRRGGSKRSRQGNRGRDEVDVDHDELDVDRDPRDGYDDEKPEPSRARRRRRRPEEENDETGDKAVKRPKIPTWSDAVAAMIETNIKTRGSKPPGQGRGKGQRRSRRR